MRQAAIWAAVGWVVAGAAVAAAAAEASGRVVDVREAGAVPDGQTLCTRAIQKAVDACAEAGGGSVRFPPGTYRSGTIVLKSGVVLDLAAGATLLASDDLDDYPETAPAFRSYTDNYTNKSLIYAEGAENVGLVGRGVIDGQGKRFSGPYKRRPYLVRMIGCREVRVEGLTFRDSPMWVQHYLACDGLTIRGVTVTSHANHNNDGIDIDCCRRVVVANCRVDSGDDAIVLKSTADRPCRDVTITGCVLRSTCNALKMGTESNGGFENVAITGCAVYDTRLAGVALEIVDGGTMDGIVVSGLTMRGVGAPVFVRLGNRARPFKKDMERPGAGTVRNISISHIRATGAGPTGCAIAGLPGQCIENVSLEDVHLVFAGGGTRDDAAREVPEKPSAYPEFNMFGRLPACGLYARHVRGLRLRNVRLATEQPDLRHAVVLDDVRDVRIEDLETPPQPKDAAPVVLMTNVARAFVTGCVPRTAGTFLRLEGPETGRITLTGNDLMEADRPVDVGPKVPEAVRRGVATHDLAAP
ncbi:MAG: glycoside hydrolase family 28 protein [Phycisphaerae bacterium]